MKPFVVIYQWGLDPYQNPNYEKRDLSPRLNLGVHAVLSETRQRWRLQHASEIQPIHALALNRDATGWYIPKASANIVAFVDTVEEGKAIVDKLQAIYAEAASLCDKAIAPQLDIRNQAQSQITLAHQLRASVFKDNVLKIQAEFKPD